MKLNNLFFALLLAITTIVVGCSKDEVVKEQSRIDASDIMLSLDKGTQTISFYAAGDWTASLSTTSWIKIDPMTRAGVAGESKVIVEWDKNTGTKERVAELTIAVRDENPVKIRLTQLPEKASLTVDKTELNLTVKPQAGNGRGQFVDTISVKSNIKWMLKNIPAWIEYSTVGDKEPQEGIPTDIQLIISADPKKFDQTVMNSTIQLGAAASSDLDVALEVSAETVLKALDADKNPVSKLTIEKSVGSNNKFVASFHLVANASWEVKSLPEWVSVSLQNNSEEYASTLLTDIVVWFNMTNDQLDTEALSGKAVFVNKQTNTELSLDLDFKGTGNDYFEYEIDHNPDQLFDASAYDSNRNPVPVAILAKPMKMYTSVDYHDIMDAPFAVHFVHSSRGIVMQRPANWLYVGFPQEPFAGKSPVISKELELSVQDRMNDLGDKFEDRYAYMIVTPASVQFDDMFEGGQLKLEYEIAAVLIGQKGMTRPPFSSDIPETVSFSAAGGEQIFSQLSGHEELGAQVQDDSWLTIDFAWTDEGLKIKVITKPNTTGAKRSQTAAITEWVGEDQVTLYEFVVAQSAE
ncbi:MAG: BACON domain-containing protein [Bacteroidales bacterium]